MSLVYLFKYLNTKKAVAATLILITVIVVAFKVNPNLGNRFFYFNDKNEDLLHKIKEWEPRLVIWSCAYDIFQTKKNTVFGNGIYSTQTSLNWCYEESITKKDRREWFLIKKYNSHNQFIDILLNYGVIGALLFLAFFISVLYDTRTNIFMQSILIALIFFGLVENFFHRQIGVYLFALILVLISNKNIKIDEKKDSKWIK